MADGMLVGSSVISGSSGRWGAQSAYEFLAGRWIMDHGCRRLLTADGPGHVDCKHLMSRSAVHLLSHSRTSIILSN